MDHMSLFYGHYKPFETPIYQDILDRGIQLKIIFHKGGYRLDCVIRPRIGTYKTAKLWHGSVTVSCVTILSQMRQSDVKQPRNFGKNLAKLGKKLNGILLEWPRLPWIIYMILFAYCLAGYYFYHSFDYKAIRAFCSRTNDTYSAELFWSGIHGPKPESLGPIRTGRLRTWRSVDPWFWSKLWWI